jgi:hypothetical protein
MLDASHVATVPRPQNRVTEGIGYRRGKAHISRAEAQRRAWLTWRSHGCEHGDRLHGVNPDGTIKEIVEPATTPQRKPKGVSSRQWRRC